MRSPLDDWTLEVHQSLGSTQTAAARALAEGRQVGAVLALEQTAGRGRFGRTWHSPPGECLAVSLVFRAYAGHPRPYLIGMSVAVAAARAFDCRLRWPNDLVINGRKVGGILTELVADQDGRSVPVVGLGVNLAQESFPEDIRDIASSLIVEGRPLRFPQDALSQVFEELRRLPEPSEWSALEPHWMPHDHTPGKLYRLQDGREAVATGIGPSGELLCTVNGKPASVLAADAILPGDP